MLPRPLEVQNLTSCTWLRGYPLSSHIEQEKTRSRYGQGPVGVSRSAVIRDLSKRPRRMLAYERLGIINGLLNHRHVLQCADVAEDHCGVALEATEFRTLHR